jgi:meiotically up-regulated gene 157 (Mug157) protein
VVAEAGRATAAYLNDAERQQLMTMFRLALTDTDRQLLMAEDGTAYVKTGDIPAEWLRDSSAQVRPHAQGKLGREAARERFPVAWVRHHDRYEPAAAAGDKA